MLTADSSTCDTRKLPIGSKHVVLGNDCPHRQTGGPPLADLCTEAGRQQADFITVSFFSADSPTGMFKQLRTDLTAQQALLSCVDKQLPAEAQQAVEGSDEAGLGWPAPARLYDSGVHNSAVQGQGLQILFAQLPPHHPPQQRLQARLLAKALATRIGPALQHVVVHTQIAFVPGHWIADNLLCHREEAEYLQQQGVQLMYTDNYTASIKQLLKVVPELNGSGHDRLPGQFTQAMKLPLWYLPRVEGKVALGVSRDD
ncbi:hypothetical protein ABBQ38_001558 [Trebouxia sp. C0009 RCD-2024]